MAWLTKDIECPRGWGSVRFGRQFLWFMFFLGVWRTSCPISGSRSCAECRYATKGVDQHEFPTSREDDGESSNVGSV